MSSFALADTSGQQLAGRFAGQCQSLDYRYPVSPAGAIRVSSNTAVNSRLNSVPAPFVYAGAPAVSGRL
jgi:hypothetical protein